MKTKKNSPLNVALCIVSLFFTILIILFNTAPTYALTLAVVPDTQQTTLGSKAEINLVVSDIPYDRAIYDYGWVLKYDSSVLSLYNEISYDPMAPGGLNANSGFIVNETFPGDQNLPDSYKGIGFYGRFEYSLSELVDLQPHTFTLATFIFDTLSPGTSLLHLFSGLIEELEGPIINPDGTLSGPRTIAYGLHDGAVTVVPGTSNVPEPTTMMLLGSGFIGLIGLRKKFQR